MEFKLNILQSKTFKTLLNINKVAKHHFGGSKFYIIKFLYYSCFRVNHFLIMGINLKQNLIESSIDLDKYSLCTNLSDLKKARFGLTLPREFYYDEMHGNSKFILLKCNNDIAYIHWIYIKGEPSRFLILGDNDAEINYSTTLEKYRGMGLMKEMLKFSFIDIKNMGYERVFTVVHKDNVPAIRSMLASGLRELGEIKAFGQFNKKFKCVACEMERL